MDENILYWIWLAEVLGPANKNVRHVLSFGSIEEIYKRRFMAAKRGYFTQKQFEHGERFTLDDAKTRLEQAKNLGMQVIPCSNHPYPAALWHLHSPPVLLYTKGDANILENEHIISVVGSRRPTAYGVQAAKEISNGLAKAGVTLASGLAAGLDSEAHKAAVREQTPTIGVVAGGADHIYPKTNRELFRQVEKVGVIVSEYPPGEEPFAGAFLQRNRIIAALGKGVLVVEARARSGTASTANHALDIGREVFAVPGSIFSAHSEGTNALLKAGASPVTSAGDILEFLGLETAEAETPQQMQMAQQASFTQDAQKVYEVLGALPMSLEEVCSKTALAPQKAIAALGELEMLGAARRLPGQMYTLAV